MIENFRSYLTSPVFEGDEEKTRAANLLNVIVLSSVLGAVFYFPFASMERRLYVALAAGLLLVIRWIMTGGHVRFASIATVIGLSALFVITIFTGGGIRAPAFSGLTVLILYAGLLLGRGGVILMTGFSILYGMLLIRIDSFGLLLASPLYTDLSHWIIDSVFFVIAGVMLTLSLQLIGDALRRARQELRDRKRAEHTLRENESRLQSIIDNEPECVKVLDLAGGLLEMNPAGLSMIEAGSAQEVIGTPIINLVLPEHKMAFAGLVERVAQGGHGKLEFEVQGFKGTRRWLETHAVPLLDEGGVPQAVLGITRDITERRKAEQSLRSAEEDYRSIFDNAPVGIFQSTPAGKYRRVNSAMAKMYGYSSSEHMIESISDISLQVYADPAVRKEFQSLLSAHGEVFQFEAKNVRADGNIIWTSTNARAVRDSADRIVYYEGFTRDITENKQAEIEITRLLGESKRRLEQVEALRTIDVAISGSMDLRITLNIVLQYVVSLLGADATNILQFNPDLQLFTFSAGRGFRTDRIQHEPVPFGASFAGRVVLERKPIFISGDLAARTGGDFAQIYRQENFLAYAGIPLIAKGRINGVLEVYFRSYHTPEPEWENLLETIAGQAAIAVDSAQLLEGLRKSNIELALAYDATIAGWSHAMDLRDKEAEGHTQRVTNLTLDLARAFHIDAEQLVHIRRGALLHDIGKMGVPDTIMLKTGELTEEEGEVMRKHPEFAYGMLSSIPYLRPALDIPYCHHEKWDGTGYPRGLKGNEIPRAARLFAVVDVWDALTSDRPYRSAWPREKAMEYIREQSGKHFDPQVVGLFLQLFSDAENKNS